MRKFLTFLSFLFAGICLGIVPVGMCSSAQAQGPQTPVILLQSEIAGESVITSGVVVLTGSSSCQALTSFEAIKGASRITAVAQNSPSVPAKIVRFAPDANLALLEIPLPNLPTAKVGDSEVLKADTPIEVNYASPVMTGDVAKSFQLMKRSGSIVDIVKRPSGSVMRVKFEQDLSDETSGAPVFAPSTGELVGISLSLNASSQHAKMRFVIPASLAGALSSNIKASPDSSADIRVLDGDEAPVLEGSAGGDGEGGSAKDEGLPLTGILAIVGAMAAIGVVAYIKLRPSDKDDSIPFAVLPLLPESMSMAFVTADGRILEMEKAVVTVGRSEDNDWCFPEPSVSGRHAKVRKNKNGTYEVEDMGSTNGTFIGGHQIGHSDVIHPGDIVRFGRKIQIKLLTRSESVLKNKRSTGKDDDMGM